MGEPDYPPIRRPDGRPVVRDDVPHALWPAFDELQAASQRLDRVSDSMEKWRRWLWVSIGACLASGAINLAVVVGKALQ